MTKALCMTAAAPNPIFQREHAGPGVVFASKWTMFMAVKGQGGNGEAFESAGQKLIRSFYPVRVEREFFPPAGYFHEFARQYKFFIPF